MPLPNRVAVKQWIGMLPSGPKAKTRTKIKASQRAPDHVLSMKRVCSMAFGVLLLIQALVLVAMYQKVLALVRSLAMAEVALTPGSMLFGYWLHPPVRPEIRVYLFNLTNAEDFLAGRHPKPRLQEVGPYVFSSTHEKADVTSLPNGHQLRFKTRAVYRKPVLNPVGLTHPGDSDEVVMLNVLRMSGMLNTEVRPLPDALKRQVVLPLLNSVGRQTPTVRVKANDFIWGYEDELACIKDLTSPGDEVTSDDDFFVETSPDSGDATSGPVSFVKTVVRRYRQPHDQRCVFGALLERNVSWEGPVVIEDGRVDAHSKGDIWSLAGATTIGAWRPGSACDALAGAKEPSAIPPLSNTTTRNRIDLFVSNICRKVPLAPRSARVQQDLRTSSDAERDPESEGHLVTYGSDFRVKALRFEPVDGIFESSPESSPDEECYFDDHHNRHLPGGVLGVQNCVEGAPMAVSMPHFYRASRRDFLLDQLEGVTPPVAEEHGFFTDVEPISGVPVSYRVRLQVNLLLRKDPAFPELEHLANELTVLPLFWAEEGFTADADHLRTLGFMVRVPDILSVGLVVVTALLGTALVLLPALTPCNPGGKPNNVSGSRKGAFPIRLEEGQEGGLPAEESTTLVPT